jgi:protein-tyrosine phosphatase
MIDYHSHILPGIDDGAMDISEALEIGRILSSIGFREVHCTPHCMRGSYLITPDLVRHEVVKLQQAFDDNGIQLCLYPGSEYYLDESAIDLLQDPTPLGNTNLVLVEAPFQGLLPSLLQLVTSIMEMGFTPIIAHPERCALFHVDPDLVPCLKSMGSLFQGNIGSFAGSYGERARNNALNLLQMGYYDCLGSDSHNPERLSSELKKGLDVISANYGEARMLELLCFKQ